ncbi:MAG: transposase [Defluviicoccus sp.]|nr:MAG: transposase [Defluviicoccus sp.]
MVLKVTDGTTSDITMAENLLAEIDTSRHVLVDKGYWQVKAAFCRPKDCRRVATRYDKLAKNDASILANATIVAYWT